MEYQVGEAWGDSAAPVANRFVTSFDETNLHMKMLEPFFKVVNSAEFDLIVLSGDKAQCTTVLQYYISGHKAQCT